MKADEKIKGIVGEIGLKEAVRRLTGVTTPSASPWGSR